MNVILVYQRVIRDGMDAPRPLENSAAEIGRRRGCRRDLQITPTEGDIFMWAKIQMSRKDAHPVHPVLLVWPWSPLILAHSAVHTASNLVGGPPFWLDSHAVHTAQGTARQSPFASCCSRWGGDDFLLSVPWELGMDLPHGWWFQVVSWKESKHDVPVFPGVAKEQNIQVPSFSSWIIRSDFKSGQSGRMVTAILIMFVECPEKNMENWQPLELGTRNWDV